MSAIKPLPSWVYHRLDEYAQRPVRQIAFSDMIKFGHKPKPETLFGAALFLADELPVRMAQRYRSLSHLPFGLEHLDQIITVQGWYAKSFMELIEWREEANRWRQNPVAIAKGINAGAPESRGGGSIWGSRQPKKDETGSGFSWLFGRSDVEQTPATPPQEEPSQLPGDFQSSNLLAYYSKQTALEPHLISAASYFNKRFTQSLINIVERHNPLVLLVAKNIKEVTKKFGLREDDAIVQHFIDRFHRTRIGMRMLIGHHVALTKPMSPLESQIGVIDISTDPISVAEDAASDAAAVCESSYGVSPPVNIQLAHGLSTVPIFVFVPGHLHQILFEIIKNSMRAIIEKEEQRVGEGNAEPYNLSPVNIWISEENEGKSIMIKISDEGVGISGKNIPKVFQYAFTTANDDTRTMIGSEAGGSPLAGYGYGLPLSRLYARYFNGDLTLTSKEGRGTDVYLILPRTFEGIMEPYM